MPTSQVSLAHVRAERYQTFGLRRDALFDLLDAILTSARVTSLVRCSLAPSYHRQWASVFDALTDGTVNVLALRHRLVQSLPLPADGTRPLWALDGSAWPRPEAKTSPERTSTRFVTPGIPESGIVDGWEYQWLAAIPEDRGSWVLPLDVRRRGPTAGTATQLAIAQLRDVLAPRPADAPRPVVVMDSHYDVPALVRAVPGVDLLARLAANRRFRQAPPPYDGHGRPRKHGPVFRLTDPITQPPPDAHQVVADADYGTVTIDAWTDLHAEKSPDVTVTVIRVAVAHLPRRAEPPAPLWLCWAGTSIPRDLRELWHAYQRRFAIEHAFRFLKQDLGWTVPRLRAPGASDRWSWLLAVALWELWLARPLVADVRLPWERPVDPARLSPGRVRRVMESVLATLGTPARVPRPRGKAPGRRRGERPGRAVRYPVQRRAPPAA
ncbi:MAG TPA: transposase [Mycobacterium sp.]|nr:transposase [Mycobacterium sp.]